MSVKTTNVAANQDIVEILRNIVEKVVKIIMVYVIQSKIVVVQNMEYAIIISAVVSMATVAMVKNTAIMDVNLNSESVCD